MNHPQIEQLSFLQLEHADVDDLSLAQLYLEAYRDMPEYGEKDLQSSLEYIDWLKRHSTFFEVALTSSNQPVGFVAASASWISRFGRGGHIHEWVVHPDWRRRGIGKKLFYDSVHHLVKAGHHKIILWAGEKNHIATTFYKKLGFKPEGKYRIWVRWVLDIKRNPEIVKQAIEWANR